MSGMLALIFLLWGPSANPNSPPEYRRSVLTPGDQRYTLPENIHNREFYIARFRLQQGYQPSAGTPIGYDFSALPARTMTECQAYLKSHYQFYEEVAKSRNQTIKAARCINIPIGKMLDAFHDDGYDDQGNRADAFRLRDIPKLPERVGPACAQITDLDYPVEAQIANVGGWLKIECQIYEGNDGYRHNRNCKIKAVQNKTTEEYFTNSTLNYETRRCWKGDPAPDPDGKPYVWTDEYAIQGR